MGLKNVRRSPALTAAALALLFVASLGGCARSRAAASDPGDTPGAPGADVKVTFVELGSVDCIPCKMMQPIMREVASTFPGDVRVVFHDVWTAEGKPYAAEFGIRVIPTQVFLDAEGREFYRHEGFFPRDDLLRLLRQRGAER